MYLVELPRRPQCAEDADLERDITLAVESFDGMISRARKVLHFLGLSDLDANPVYNPAIPSNMPSGFWPDPKALFAALKKTLSPANYSAIVLKLMEKFGDGMDGYYHESLTSGLVKADPLNLRGWDRCLKDQPAGTINLYQRGFCPITRFQTDERPVYNLSANDARKPLFDNRMTPGGPLEWAIAFALFPELQPQIVKTDPYVAHPGGRVRDDRGDWVFVSGCWEFCKRAQCREDIYDYVDSEYALFALL